jgi:hypothetical protein
MKISRSQLRSMIKEVMADLEEDALFLRPDILGLQPEKDIPGQSPSPVCKKCKMRHPVGGCGPHHSDHKEVGRNLSYGDRPSGDREARMTRSQLFKIARYAQSLHDMLHDDDDLPEWVQSKISVMDNDIGKVKHYLEYKLKRMKS